MKVKKELIVGIVTVIGIAALVWGFFFMKGKNLFKEEKTYVTYYPKSDGLSVGSSVKLHGVDVGRVTSVEVNTDTYDNTIIKFSLKDPEMRIPMGTRAELHPDILGGAAIGLIYPEIKSGNYHKPNDVIPSAVAAGLQQTLEAKIDPLQAKIEELLGTADSAIVTIQTIFSNNTGNLNESFEGLNKSVQNVENITQSVDSLTYTLSANRYKIVTALDNINVITQNLAENKDEINNIIANFSDLSDTLSKLDINNTITEINDALASVNMLLTEIKDGDGTISKLMEDSLLYDNINAMVNEATSLVNNIKQHPNRYLQFAVFGGKDKGLKLSTGDEKKLKKFVRDSL